MATKNLKTIHLNLKLEGGSVTGGAKGKFEVEGVAFGFDTVQLNADTSLADAKAAVITKLEEDGSTVVDETGE